MRKAQENGPKVHKILCDWAGTAMLYRMCTSGPSGQRTDVAIGRVWYAYDRTGWELEVTHPRTGEVVGYMSRDNWRHAGMWTVHSHCNEFPDWELNRLLGWASCPALGADVLVNGVHAATGRHDWHRVSAGRWESYRPAD